MNDSTADLVANGIALVIECRALKDRLAKLETTLAERDAHIVKLRRRLAIDDKRHTVEELIDRPVES